MAKVLDFHLGSETICKCVSDETPWPLKHQIFVSLFVLSTQHINALQTRSNRTGSERPFRKPSALTHTLSSFPSLSLSFYPSAHSEMNRLLCNLTAWLFKGQKDVPPFVMPACWRTTSHTVTFCRSISADMKVPLQPLHRYCCLLFQQLIPGSEYGVHFTKILSSIPYTISDFRRYIR